MHEETEFKLSLSPSVASRILRYKGLRPHRKGRRVKRHLVSTYFDTPRHALRKSDIVLRVRDNGEGREQTVKAPFQGPAGLQNFREWTVPVNGDCPNLCAVDDPALSRELSLRRYEKRFRTENLSERFLSETARIRANAPRNSPNALPLPLSPTAQPPPPPPLPGSSGSG